MKYEYVTENNLENRQRYQYTKYYGEEFLSSYFNSRREAADLNGVGDILLVSIGNKYISEANADQILKSFEVRKRIYRAYNEKYKPIDEQDYKNFQFYLDFASLMAGMYEKSKNLKYLNSFLKVDDTLLSIWSLINGEQKALLGKILSKEMLYVKAVRESAAVEVDDNIKDELADSADQKYVLPDIAIVCANSTRTKAYLQVLGRAGINIGKAYIMNLHPQDMIAEAKVYHAGEEEEVFFDSKTPILYTLKEQDIPFEFINSEDINSEETYRFLKGAKEKYFIYSGFGGQILKPHLFNIGKKYIHTHAGMVPEFRGSTTVYYHMLVTGNTAASVMFLNEQLDEGDILSQRYFRFPREVKDIDLIYEPYTRAIALKDALSEYAVKGEFSGKLQSKDGNTYYIIHPVLKHIAILALKAAL